MSEEYAEKEIGDCLEEDKPIPRQNFVCLSFVSPEKVLLRKEEFMFYNYLLSKLRFYNEQINSQITNMVEEAEDSTVDISKIIKMKKSIAKLWKNDNVEFEKFKEAYDGFIFKEGDKLGDEFDRGNDFQTSVRGIKVRGVYNTREEADVRCKVLQRLDKTFDVFVGSVGYWLPWDPEAAKIEDCSYLNEDLNRLVNENKNNEIKKEHFFHEQKRTRVNEAEKVSERLKKKLAAKKASEAEEKEALKKKQVRDSENEKLNVEKKHEMSTDDISKVLDEDIDDLKLEDKLTNDDPWVQQKMKKSSNDEPKIEELDDDES